tara:strand:- start:1425 stop:2636 length:1212 start_codon:yes stop_codon:yes gene_type:complete
MFLANKLVNTVFFTCILAMAIPYIFDLGEGNVFVNDYYAKRIMSIVILPLFLYVFVYNFLNRHSVYRKKILYYFIWVSFVFLISIFHNNAPLFILVDLFIFILPLLFYLLVYNTDFDTERFSKSFPFLMLFSSLVLIFGVKLQFSYFTLLVVGYTIFIFKKNFITLLLFLLLPLILVNSLIGKNSIILLSIIIIYFFLFDKNFVSIKKKVFLLSVPLIIIVVLLFIFWDKIKETGAFVNTMYFLENTNFSRLEFKDHSTAHRLFEAVTVFNEFISSPMLYKLFGKGFGSTIDLSNTIDSTLSKTNNDVSQFRVIHLGVFAVLHKLGLFGVITYFYFLIKMFNLCKKILKKSLNPMFVLMALYVIIIIIDSLISFTHMMSNFMFWLLCLIIIYENETKKSYASI